jgi:hypothetical protein
VLSQLWEFKFSIWYRFTFPPWWPMTQAAVSSFLYLLLKTLSLNIRKCGAVIECQIVTLKDRGSRPGHAAFEAFQLCRRSSTF